MELKGGINMNYFIGQGTSVTKEFETLNEMFEFHKKMSDEDRHFCKLYDKEKHRIADGWNIQYNYTDETKWRAW